VNVEHVLHEGDEREEKVSLESVSVEVGGGPVGSGHHHSALCQQTREKALENESVCYVSNLYCAQCSYMNVNACVCRFVCLII
jgi:hypothetical protein